MAKMNIKGGVLATFDNHSIGTRYSVRGDGAILRQARIDGRLESATIIAKVKPEVADKVGAFNRYLANRGLMA